MVDNGDAGSSTSGSWQSAIATSEAVWLMGCGEVIGATKREGRGGESGSKGFAAETPAAEDEAESTGSSVMQSSFAEVVESESSSSPSG